MSIRTVGLALGLLTVGLLDFKVPRAGQLPADLEKPLNEVALASLQADHDILVTGQRPADGLVARYIGWTRQYITGDAHIDGVLKGRQKGLERGVRYTAVEVTLAPTGVERRGNKVILHAKDRFTEHRRYEVAVQGPSQTESGGVTNHDFVFSVVPASAGTPPGPYSVEVGGIVYTLILDVNEPQLLQSRDASTCCCDPDELQYASQPIGPPLEDKAATPHKKQ